MELFRALAAYCESASPVVAAALEVPVAAAAERTELFDFQLYPYASVYLGAEGMLGGEARDRVAGFWRAVGVAPPPEPDHLAALLALLAACSEVGGQRGRHLRHALLWEHLLSWLPGWLARVGEIGPAGYREWATLLKQALAAEAAELGPPELLPLHLRLAPEPDGVASALMAVRSAVILTRADLARLARDLGLGLRQGERVYILEALLAQHREAVVDWLVVEAARQARLWRAQPAEWEPVTSWWAERAERTAELASVSNAAI